MDKPLSLQGLAGQNPLCFLAALGTVSVASELYPSVSLSWRVLQGTWRPMIWHCGDDENRFVEELHNALKATPSDAFKIDKKLPFEVSAFASALLRAQVESSFGNRRTADLLASFGSEIVVEEGVFESTAFRMVRSCDSDGQGLPAYALSIRENTNKEDLYRTLFQPWDYRDKGSSLRWDPMEDQRYALRWHDPSPSSNKKFGPQTMRGANALALEALALLPAFPRNGNLATTGFARLSQRREFFTWPIWDSPLTLDPIRSLLSLADLQKETPPRNYLAMRGIVEVYRCERLAPNQYYKNFTPAQPV